MLGDLSKLKIKSSEEGVTVELPAKPLDAINTVVVLKVEGKLDVELIIPVQNDKGVIELPAEMADIHNRISTRTKLEGEKGKENISSWTAGAWIEWMFEVKAKGTFEVIADVAVNSAETKFTVAVSTSTLQAAVTSTGGDDKYKQVSLGQIEVSKAGVHTLRIKPIRKQWKPLNLRSASLRPVK